MSEKQQAAFQIAVVNADLDSRRSPSGNSGIYPHSFTPPPKLDGIRREFHHVIDILPGLVEATGIPQPKMLNGIKQSPIETCMAYTEPLSSCPVW